MFISAEFFASEIPDGIEFDMVYRTKNYVIENLDPWKFDPFDWYTSMLEDFIMQITMVIGVWYFADLLICSIRHEHAKTINSNNNKNNSNKKFWEKIKYAKTKSKTKK